MREMFRILNGKIDKRKKVVCMRVQRSEEKWEKKQRLLYRHCSESRQEPKSGKVAPSIAFFSASWEKCHQIQAVKVANGSGRVSIAGLLLFYLRMAAGGCRQSVNVESEMHMTYPTITSVFI
jgi:hypothetical protein